MTQANRDRKAKALIEKGIQLEHPYVLDYLKRNKADDPAPKEETKSKGKK